MARRVRLTSSLACALLLLTTATIPTITITITAAAAAAVAIIVGAVSLSLGKGCAGELTPPQTFKISPSTDALRYAQAQETPPGWPSQPAPHSPARQTPADNSLFPPSSTPQTFNADFELFGPADPPPQRTSVPESSASNKQIGDAVFNLGYTTSLPPARNWSAVSASTPTNSLVQRSPFVPAAAEFNPALIEALSDVQRSNLIRGISPRLLNTTTRRRRTSSSSSSSSSVNPETCVVSLPPIAQIFNMNVNSLEPVLQLDIDMFLEDSDSPSASCSPSTPSPSHSPPSAFVSPLLNNGPKSTEFSRRQRNMEEELLSLAGLEASPLHANDMTFSPNNPLFHDFSPFIGTIPYTGRTNDTLDDSPTGLDTPLFGVDDAALDDWTPLFSSEEQMDFAANQPAPVPMEHTPSTDALINPAALMLGGSESTTPPLSAVIPSRQFSTDSNKSRSPPSPSPQSKPLSINGKRASLTGVSRRKAAADLPPVQFDPSNPVDIKRARNTMAARKSRARRVEKMEELAEAVDKLQAEAQALKEEREYYKNLARQHGALVD
ncbi:hypothetical protein H072_3202 [Dactylellina haptotyla CBS 200.50]|uniref:BZIP domain-containing protein n=1 Tax=Dactylellina haptotyla (strain CBS 200.50) TaxID=1284197 RepID=S8AP85_DACHA|nr:hypothetical protein H072_3202 [Dactylellina haptotyla CBS 200.50]